MEGWKKASRNRGKEGRKEGRKEGFLLGERAAVQELYAVTKREMERERADLGRLPTSYPPCTLGYFRQFFFLIRFK